MSYLIRQRKVTMVNWESIDPILAKGEIGIEISSDNIIKIKVGNGVAKWSELNYIFNSEDISLIYSSINTLTTNLNNLSIDVTDTVTEEKYQWGMENGVIFLEKVVEP